MSNSVQAPLPAVSEVRTLEEQEPERCQSVLPSSPRVKGGRGTLQWRRPRGGSCTAARQPALASDTHRHVARLEDELQSLRDMYSRKIANTELRCERLLAEKDEEKNNWYAEQKRDVRQYQAALVVMHALFQSKCGKLKRAVEVEKRESISMHQSFLVQLTNKEEQMREEGKQKVQEFSRKVTAYEQHIHELSASVAEARESLADARQRLAEEQREGQRLREEVAAKTQDINNLKMKQQGLDDQANLVNLVKEKGKQIEVLEGELARQRRVMERQRLVENESLREEVLDYVKFIVHKLPSNWEDHTGATDGYQVPSYLKERLSAALEKKRCASPAAAAPISRESNSALDANPFPDISDRFQFPTSDRNSVNPVPSIAARGRNLGDIRADSRPKSAGIQVRRRIYGTSCSEPIQRFRA